MELYNQLNWFNNGEYLCLNGRSEIKDKFFGFDLDGTLTTYKDGLDPVRFPDNPSNWHFLGEIKSKILELNENYTIVIITNQLNISQSKLGMIEQVYLALDCIPYILIAPKRNQYRKPNPGFMNVINHFINSSGKILNVSESYYCGDTVGPHDPFPPYRRDTSDDYLFATNSGINFIRPCDLFPKFSFVPYNLDSSGTYIGMKYQLIIMMGNPGSGKTSYSKFLEQNYGYIRFSQDECGPLDKQGTITQITSTLMSGRNVVLDATFPSFQKKLPFLTIGKQLNLSMAIIWCIRDGRPFNKLREKPVSHFAYDSKNGYTKNFNDPEERPMSISYDIIKLY